MSQEKNHAAVVVVNSVCYDFVNSELAEVSFFSMKPVENENGLFFFQRGVWKSG